MTSSNSNTGNRNMQLVGHEALLQQTEALEPITAVFEGGKNGWEAGATLLQLFPNSRNRVTLRDNGSGIPFGKIESQLGNFGATSKTAGAGKGRNLGWGISLTAAGLNPENGALVTTWTPDAPHAFACKLGITPDRNFALLAHGPRGERIVQVQKPVNTPSGTQIEFGDFGFDADQLIDELGQRFVEFRSNASAQAARVLIYTKLPGENPDDNHPVAAQSLLDRIRSASISEIEVTVEKQKRMIPGSGEIQTDHAHARWFVLPRAGRGIFGLYEYWNNEVVRRVSRGLSSAHNSYGIWAGSERIVLLVERRNRPGETEIVADLHRVDALHWLDVEGKAEVSAVINAPCPPNPDWHALRLFMLGWEEANYKRDADADEVRETLRRWHMGSTNLESPDGSPTDEEGGTKGEPGGIIGGGTEGGGEGGEGGEGGNGGGKPKPPRRKRPRKDDLGELPTNGIKHRGLPECWYSKNMGATAASYKQGRHLLLLNPDWGVTSQVREQARRDRKLKGADRRLKAHLINGFNQFHKLTGRIPTDDELLAIAANPTAALDYVYTEATFAKKAVGQKVKGRGTAKKPSTKSATAKKGK